MCRTYSGVQRQVGQGDNNTKLICSLGLDRDFENYTLNNIISYS